VNTQLRSGFWARPTRQAQIDRRMIELDGTRTRAGSAPTPITRRYLATTCGGERRARAAVRAISGGLIAGGGGARETRSCPCDDEHHQRRRARQLNSIDIQEFMDPSLGRTTFREALRYGGRGVPHLKKLLRRTGLSTAVGDEGGLFFLTPNWRRTGGLSSSCRHREGRVPGRGRMCIWARRGAELGVLQERPI